MKIRNAAISIGFILVLFTLLFSSCKQSKQSETEDKQKKQEELSVDTLESEVREVVYPLPSPFEVYEDLQRIGASYLGDVLNPVSNADKYFSENEKALNLGVYSADLSYVTTYDKTQEMQRYSRVVRSMMNNLDIDIEISNLSQESIKERFQNKDSLVNYVTNIFHKTYSFLNKKGDPSLSALMVAGIWSEGLYIATHISKDTYDTYEIVKLIHEQKTSLEKVMKIMNRFQDNETVSKLHDDFETLMKLYEEAGDSLTQDQFNAIKTQIAKIREKIVA